MLREGRCSHVVAVFIIRFIGKELAGAPETERVWSEAEILSKKRSPSSTEFKTDGVYAFEFPVLLPLDFS